jgi:hypothetical protein
MIVRMALSLVIVSGAIAAQTPTAPTWTLKARINGAELVGEAELAKVRITGGDAASAQATEGAVFSIARHSSFQIAVDLVDPNGVRREITGDAKLAYRSDNCLTISASGFATATPASSGTVSCIDSEYVPLTIIYQDAVSQVSAVNIYLLKVQ